MVLVNETHNSNQRNVRSGVTALSSTSSSFGTVVTNGRLDANGIDEHLKQQILAEEEAAMNQFKVSKNIYLHRFSTLDVKTCICQMSNFEKNNEKFYFCKTQQFISSHLI